MRSRIALALSLSVILVVFASWNRFVTVENTMQNIALVELAPSSDEYYNELLRTYTEVDRTVTESNTKPLNSTDLVGRQFIMDYIDLASNGQASATNLDQLALKYAESIPTLISAPRISYFDIKTVANNTENIQTYSDQLGVLYDSHSKKIEAILSKQDHISTDDKITFLFAEDAMREYEELTVLLRNIPVPLVLAVSHVDLINNYLASVAAMRSLKDASDDPMLALAGIIIHKENLDREIVVLREIDEIFKSNGIQF